MPSLPGNRRRVAVTVVAAFVVAAVASFLMTAEAQARPGNACAGRGLVVVVNGTNDDPPPDTTPAMQRYLRQGYRAFTLQYPATVWPLGSSTYDDNVRLAEPRLAQLIDWHTWACPQQPLALVGFSQGARIIGDVVSAIGHGRELQTARGMRRVSVPANKIRVELYADPRRDRVAGQRGAGIETLFPDYRVYPGLTMTGSRVGGFGSLAHRVVEVCIIGDPICDSVRPDDAGLIPALIDGVFRFSMRHTHYGPEVGQPMADDPWRHATNGTWMVEPPPF